MNTLIKTFLLAAVILLPACEKKQEQAAAVPVAPPAAVAAQPPPESIFDTGMAKDTAALLPAKDCKDCQWSNVLTHEAPVSYLGCIKGNSPDSHCHMKVVDSLPESTVVVTEPSPGVYHFVMTTKDHPETGLDCSNLSLHPNPQIIWGQCTVSNLDMEGPPEHDFAAKLERLAAEQGGGYRIRFKFVHGWSATDRVPIHNGEGHAHPN